MPIHIGDYKRDTGHLRAAGHGAYLLLLFHHWSTGSLPTEDEQLAAIACMTKQEWRKHKPIIAKFFSADWNHARVVDDLQKANESYQRRAKAGSEGGKAKAMPKPEPSNARAMLKQPITDNLEEDRIVDARAGASVFTEASKSLADAFLKSLGYENPLQIPPEVCGTDWRALEWERAGFTADLIASEARRVGPGKPLSYYEKCFATAFAKRQAPLPKVEVRQVETITVTNNAKPQSAIIQAADDLVRKLTSFDGPAREPDDLRGGEGETSPRLLSHG